jgi:glutamate 5-kinase
MSLERGVNVQCEQSGAQPPVRYEMSKQARSSLKYSRIVAKFGTNILTAGTERIDLEVMAALVSQVARLQAMGAEVVVVTSGAIAAGRHRLAMARATKAAPGGQAGLAFRQVLAAVGQSDLMQAYQELFETHGIVVAQTLLTGQDLSDRTGYLNARNTLLAMLELKVVPVVNENDVVAVDEIEGPKIGDNDNLSALVANLVDADLLAILTDTGGLYTADPRLHPEATLIPRVEKIDADIEALASGSVSGAGTGGMTTKLQAARLATGSGTDTAIVAGREPDVLIRLAEGEEIGTFFPATADRMESRKRWMLAGLSVRGSLVVDDGAAKVLREANKSLLPAGVRDVKGTFRRGDAVSIVNGTGERIAVGIANYDAVEIAQIKGKRSDRIEEVLGHHYGDEVVHRDNLVCL